MKKMLAALALCLCLGAVCLPALAGEGSFVMNTPEEGLIVTYEGQALTPRGAYDYIEAAGDWYLACKAGESAVVVLDSQGVQVLEDQFQSAYADENMLYLEKDGLVGAMDFSLAWQAPCAYTQIISNGEGGFLALSSDPYDEQPDGVYYLDGQGGEKATGVKVKYGLSRFSQGLMPVMDGVTGRMGYLDAEGQWAITAQYQYAGEFVGGAAEATLPAGAGYIDMQGNWLLTPKYMYVNRSMGQKGLVLAQEDSSQILLLDGEDFSLVKSFSGTDIYFSAGFEQDVAILYLDDSTLLIDREGNTLFESEIGQTFDAWSAGEGRMLVSQGDWGEACVWLYDTQGRQVAGPWQEAWLLGTGSRGPVYGVTSFDTRLFSDEAMDLSLYEALEDSYQMGVVDAQGSQVVPMGAYTSLDLEGDVIVFQDEKGAGAFSLDGTQLCYFEAIEGEK